MKIKIAFILCILTCLFGISASAIDYPEISAPAALVMCPETGDVLYDKNSEEKMYPASTTKMMTALLAIELGNMDAQVTVMPEDLSVLKNTGSSINLKENEVLTLKQLLYYLLVASGNDAANVIARHIGGTPEEFVSLMNNRAAELGCFSTNFVNPHGLHDENHYTTASDLYKIAVEAMKHEIFADACSTDRYILPATDYYPKERVFYNTNNLVSRWRSVDYYYPKAIGIKTGSTSQAGYCLVSAASSKGSTYYCVVMGASKDPATNKIMSFVESKQLLEWAFSSYQVKSILTTDTPIKEIPVELSSDFDYVVAVPKESVEKLILKDIDVDQMERTISLPDKLSAPIEKGQLLGSVSVSYGGTTYATVDLVAATSVERSNGLFILSLVQSFFSSFIFKLFIFIVICAVTIFIVLCVIRNRNRRRRKKRRR